jgi:uncharacterized membrane protein
VPSVTEKVAEVEPCGMVAVFGTFTRAGAALSAIVAPPLNAADVSATVQVDPADGVSDAGLHDMLLRPGTSGLTVRPNVLLTPE